MGKGQENVSIVLIYFKNIIRLSNIFNDLKVVLNFFEIIKRSDRNEIIFVVESFVALFFQNLNQSTKEKVLIKHQNIRFNFWNVFFTF
jgi:hypothetical protein